MLERFVHLKECVVLTLNELNASHMWNEDEEDYYKVVELLKVFGPIKLTVEALGEECDIQKRVESDIQEPDNVLLKNAIEVSINKYLKKPEEVSCSTQTPIKKSNTILTYTSPLESVIKPAKVYPGKRCLVQPIAKLGDIPGPSHEYVHVTSNIATVPGSKDTLSRESSSNDSARMAPELCTPKKFKDDILPGESPFTAVTSTISASATVSSVRRLNLKAVGITQQKHLSPRNKISYEGVKKLKKLVHRQEVRNKNIKADLKNSQSALLQNFENVNKYTRNFILSQNKNQKLKPRGRRFSLEVKFLLCQYSSKAERVTDSYNFYLQ
uniref:Uncharacterized protein n=1 Tax=Dendroctonus ponderosae TaxID=77166 RepID=A0AAR5PGS0_DENPD